MDLREVERGGPHDDGKYESTLPHLRATVARTWLPLMPVLPDVCKRIASPRGYHGSTEVNPAEMNAGADQLLFPVSNQIDKPYGFAMLDGKPAAKGHSTEIALFEDPSIVMLQTVMIPHCLQGHGSHCQAPDMREKTTPGSSNSIKGIENLIKPLHEL